MVLLKEDIIRELFIEMFISIDCSPDVYLPVIESLIQASLRGVDSHGICLITHYIEAALIGRINISPHYVFEERAPSVAMLDADHTYGIAAAIKGMEKAIELAVQAGVGCVSVFNSSHFGAAATYTNLAAQNGMIGIAFTNVDALVLPYGAKDPFLGTNPICFSAPCKGEEPFCLDMATSIISWNRLRKCRDAGKELDPRVAADKDGRECINPNNVNALLPIGGYKGYGLALAVEVLCSLLNNMPFGTAIPRMFPLTNERRKLGHFLMAINIAMFQPLSDFKARMRQLLDALRALSPVEGFDKVRVAGDPEKEAYRERHARGIPIETDDVMKLSELLHRLNIDGQKYHSVFRYA
jgi:ureidoglycolate dehydrogenase (NAD+)